MQRRGFIQSLIPSILASKSLPARLEGAEAIEPGVTIIPPGRKRFVRIDNLILEISNRAPVRFERAGRGFALTADSRWSKPFKVTSMFLTKRDPPETAATHGGGEGDRPLQSDGIVMPAGHSRGPGRDHTTYKAMVAKIHAASPHPSAD